MVQLKLIGIVDNITLIELCNKLGTLVDSSILWHCSCSCCPFRFMLLTVRCEVSDSVMGQNKFHVFLQHNLWMTSYLNSLSVGLENKSCAYLSVCASGTKW